LVVTHYIYTREEKTREEENIERQQREIQIQRIQIQKSSPPGIAPTQPSLISSSAINN
jgi:hypothetical protein